MPDALEYATIDVDESVGGRPVVHLAGDFDLATSETLRATLLGLVEKEHPAGIVLDLARVAFIDSEAIGAILDGYSAAAEVGAEFRLRHAYGAVRRVFQLLGLLALFDDTAPTATLREGDRPESA